MDDMNTPPSSVISMGARAVSVDARAVIPASFNGCFVSELTLESEWVCSAPSLQFLLWFLLLSAPSFSILSCSDF